MKIGFACKYVHFDGDKKVEKIFNATTTTARYLSTVDAEQKLDSVIQHNLDSTKRLVEYVSTLPNQLKMLRFTSTLLPLYSHPEYKSYYAVDKKEWIRKHLKQIGDFCIKHNIRTSFHPGQFTALSSDKPHVVNNSIDEIEYHVDMTTMMGFVDRSQCKINVHVHGILGVDGFKSQLTNLSDNALKFLTVENTEYKYDLDSVLNLGDIIPIVLDLHHEKCFNGEYISFSDKRIKDVIASWKGIRPVMHYSNSRGFENKTEIRAHSDFLWDTEANKIVIDYLSDFDIMIEAKKKNLASIKFYNDIKKV